MAFYWVNIGKTFQEVEKHGFLWAPAYNINKKGNRTLPAGWKHVPKVKKGDILFCNLGGHVKYIAEADKDAYRCERPINKEYKTWKNDGYKIEVSITNLAVPTPIGNFINEFIDLHNHKTSPKLFNVNSGVTENYLYYLGNEAGVYLINQVSGFRSKNAAISADSDLDDERGKTLSQTERKQFKWHKVYEGRVNTKKVKDILKHTCQACKFTFTDMYGDLGKDFIEAHHLVPYSELKEGEQRKLNIEKDFVVLCANCHRMIHRMENPDDISGLRLLIEKTQRKTKI